MKKPRLMLSAALLFAVACTAYGLLGVRPTVAQERTDNYAIANPGDPQKTVDDDTMRKAAIAYPKVKAVNQQVEQKLATATDKKERKQILDHGRARQLAAVHDAGITSEQYTEVVRDIQADPALKRKFAQYVSVALHSKAIR